MSRTIPHDVARPRRRAVSCLLASVLCSACALHSAAPDLVNRPYPTPALTASGSEIGRASWYGPGFHRKRTANGETYDQNAMTAAHRTLPLGTWIQVTDRSTAKSVIVRVNDRGPYHAERVLDLSYGAAQKLGSVERGVADVEIRVLQPGYASYPTVRYSVQLAAYTDRHDAERLAGRLTALPAPAYISILRSDPPVYRVRIGPYVGRVRAHDVATQLRREGFRPVIVEINPPPDTPRAATPGRRRTLQPAAKQRTPAPRTS